MANDSVQQTFARLVQHITEKFLRGNIQLSDLIGLSDSEIDLIFLTGHHLYNYGKYKQALQIFGVLTLYKPFISRFWRAAGAANQALRKYAEAIVAYDMALNTNPQDAISLTYRGESKIAHGDERSGIKDLQNAIKVGEQNSRYHAWVRRARTLLQVRQSLPQG